MSGHSTHQPHGSGIRGLTNEAIDRPGGRFGRIFNLQPAEFSVDALAGLAAAMVAPVDDAKDGPDPEESHIPAAYTYLGQFIDHDLTFDPSTFQQQKHDPAGIEDFRTPRFDLDNLYGRGPSDQPFMYDRSRLLLGERFIPIERNPAAHDLPRAASSSLGIRRAIIGDPRNDENVIVSQLHGMFLRFHNRLVDLTGDSFDAAAEKVRWHYQWMVLHDFLPRIVDPAILAEVSPGFADPGQAFTAKSDLKFFKPQKNQGFMPVEFSVAAYRLGHSMVRPAYRLNEFTGPLPIFDAENPTGGLNAFGEFPKSWTIDWQRFLDVGLRNGPETDRDRVQLAYRLDTSLVDPLGHLPKSIAGDEAAQDPRLASLAFRNLLRGQKLRLPSGQAVAMHMGHSPLRDEEILIGKAETGSAETKDASPIASIHADFKGRAPLWTYILAEARKSFFHGGKAHLGPVGGRIVAEVFLGLILSDSRSYVYAQPRWVPTHGQNGAFTLADLLRQALAA